VEERWERQDDDADCPFCAITHGRQAEASVVFEAAHAVGFLDRRPLFPGHVLLVPRAHVPTFEDLTAGEVAALFADAQLLSHAVRRATDSPGSFVAVNNRVSQSVPHMHVHIVPRRPHDGLRGFFWPRHRYASAEEEAAVAKAIRAALAELSGGEG
jgi:histidine triad (HIT) family protein